MREIEVLTRTQQLQLKAKKKNENKKGKGPRGSRGDQKKANKGKGKGTGAAKGKGTGAKTKKETNQGKDTKAKKETKDGKGAKAKKEKNQDTAKTKKRKATNVPQTEASEAHDTATATSIATSKHLESPGKGSKGPTRRRKVLKYATQKAKLAKTKTPVKENTNKSGKKNANKSGKKNANKSGKKNASKSGKIESAGKRPNKAGYASFCRHSVHGNLQVCSFPLFYAPPPPSFCLFLMVGRKGVQQVSAHRVHPRLEGHDCEIQCLLPGLLPNDDVLVQVCHRIFYLVG